MAELKLVQLCKKYPPVRGEIQNNYAVDHLSLHCMDGEFIGILGPSGCGKTTTLRMIAGLEKITKGDIFIGDTKVNDLHPRMRQIGLAFEDYALYPPLNVYDNMAFNLRAKKIPEDKIRAEIMRIAPLLQVDDLLDSRPIQLSGGQKQRVNIARAIIRKPKLLLLDEPLSHLDGKMRQVLRTEIKRLHKEIHCTTILVTHDQFEAMSLADRIAIMHEGQLQQVGTPLEVFDNPANEFVADFIGEPPMNILTSNFSKIDGQFFFDLAGSNVRIPVPRQYYPVAQQGRTVRWGVRPNDLRIVHQSSTAFGVRVTVVENLGEEMRICVRVGNEYLTLTTTEEIRFHPNDLIQLEVETDKTHLFDVENGARYTSS